jgi:hypothetical protein
MKIPVPRTITKHENLKQDKSLERRIENRRIERLQQILAVKISQRARVPFREPLEMRFFSTEPEHNTNPASEKAIIA